MRAGGTRGLVDGVRPGLGLGFNVNFGFASWSFVKKDLMGQNDMPCLDTDDPRQPKLFLSNLWLLLWPPVVAVLYTILYCFFDKKELNNIS